MPEEMITITLPRNSAAILAARSGFRHRLSPDALFADHVHEYMSWRRAHADLEKALMDQEVYSAS